MHVIEIDFRDSVEAAFTLKRLPFLTFLDSARVDDRLGRYSFIAADPFATIQGKELDAGWVARLKSILAECRTPNSPGLPPFQGGAAGLFSYELGRSLERLPEPARDDLAFPDLSLGLYDVVVAFDLLERRGFILSTGLPEKEPAARARRAIERGEWFRRSLRRRRRPRRPAQFRSRAGPAIFRGRAMSKRSPR